MRRGDTGKRCRPGGADHEHGKGRPPGLPFGKLFRLKRAPMPSADLIDTFDAFESYWAMAKDLPIDRRIDLWASQYMSAWPELLEKQQCNYAEMCHDWKDIAREHVFGRLGEALQPMRRARGHLLELCPSVWGSVREKLGLDGEVVFVIYVGIGCGAGWVTQYDGKPAVLLGLENIAECGWSERRALTGLLAHELGHVAHYHWREQTGLANGEGPLWDLYDEGFAQYCEHLVAGEDTWHMNEGYNPAGWAGWCRENLAWLAAEFVRRLDDPEGIRAFFGSWYEIKGHSQCGYFLGHELIAEMAAGMSVKEIALLPTAEAERRIRAGLRRLTGKEA